MFAQTPAKTSTSGISLRIFERMHLKTEDTWANVHALTIRTPNLQAYAESADSRLSQHTTHSLQSTAALDNCIKADVCMGLKSHSNVARLDL